jgi:hypothetical protein
MTSAHTSPSHSSSDEPAHGGVAHGKLIQDVCLAVGLIVALGAVFLLEPEPTPTVDAENVLREVEPAPSNEPEPEPVPLPRLGVTPAQYDDIGRLLKELGEAYHYDNVPLDGLMDPELLGKYDILFLTCGTVDGSWLGDRISQGNRPGTEVRVWKPEVKDRVDKALRGFVENGGTLYASDFRYSLVSSAFPEFVDLAAIDEGDRQEVSANVIDAGLEELLGSPIKLQFDLPGWRPAAFREHEVTTYLKGNYVSLDGGEKTAPLLVKFSVGEGTVIFTSFHNEKQNSETELELLRYLVFAAVTARTESRIKKTMLQGGFSPAKQNLLSAKDGQLKVTKTYDCAGNGDLQFVLGFESRGAELMLEIVGPDGQTFEQKGGSTFQIEVPNATAGAWKYTVTALKVPYKNFPFTLTVGERK